MKRCPQCQSVYEEAKNFCLNDGTPLVADSTEARPVTPTPPAPDTQQFQSAPTQSVGWAQADSRQQQPASSWQAQHQSVNAAAPGKRRVWPWVLGIVGVVALGGVALLGVVGYIGYKAVKDAERRVTTGGSGTTCRADLQTYVNSPGSFTGNLAEHYSDFSFQYPNNWVVKEPAGQSGSNFVKVERSLDGSTTLENFAVGWYTSTGTATGDAALFPQLAKQLSAQFAAGFPRLPQSLRGAHARRRLRRLRVPLHQPAAKPRRKEHRPLRPRRDAAEREHDAAQRRRAHHAHHLARARN